MATAKEVFEALKVLSPEITSITKHQRGWVHDSEGCTRLVKCEIDWGGHDCYPPPEPKWRPATKADACRAIMEGPIPCRVRDNVGSEWMTDMLHGYGLEEVYLHAWAGSRTFWRYCEVQK
jgi:hypothetical protein